MVKSSEIWSILIITLILGGLLSLGVSWTSFLYSVLTIFLVIMINIFSKKIAAYYLDSEIEIKTWEFKRFGFKPGKHFSKPFPIGIFLPILTAVLSIGYFIWMAGLTFEISPKTYRAAKRFGLYTFSEMTEYHIGIIASLGIIANILFALIGYLIGFETFARWNIYYAVFSLIPLSDLDGNKVFFGNITLWTFLSIISLIGLGYALFLI